MMQCQKTDNCQRENKKNDESCPSFDKSRDKDISWQGLMKRYKRLIRLKKNDKDTRDGVLKTSLTMFLSVIFSVLLVYPSLPAIVSSIPISVILGLVAGCTISGYFNRLDNFVNAHIGAVSGLLLSIYMGILVIIGGSVSMSLIPGLLGTSLWFICCLTVAAIGYGSIGESMRG